MRSDVAVEIDAPPALVFALARDVERWDRLLPHYARSRVVARAADRDARARVRGAPAAGRPCSASGYRSRGERGVGASRPACVCASSTCWSDAGHGRDVADRAGRAAASPGTRVTIEHDFAPRVPGFAAFVDRASPGRSPAGRSRRSRHWPRRSQPTRVARRAVAPRNDEAPASERPRRRPCRYDGTSPRLDHRHRHHHGDRHRTRRVPGRSPGGPFTGPPDRPVRSEPVPLAGRRPGRRLRPARLDAARRRPASSTGSASSGWSPVGWRSRMPASRRAPAAPRRPSGSASTSARRSAASPMPRSSTSATSSAASARSRRTSRWPCSAGPRRRTSGSPWGSAGRSSRPPIRAHRARWRSARRCGDLRDGRIDAAIAGGCEIPLSPLAFGAFDIIRALSGRPQRRRRTGPPGRSMPRATGSSWARAPRCWSSRRPTSPSARGAVPYAEVMGYGATSDAHHMVQPRADGREAARAATIALDDARRRPGRDRLRQRPRLVDADRRRGRGPRDQPRPRRARGDRPGERDEGAVRPSARRLGRDRSRDLRPDDPRRLGTRVRESSRGRSCRRVLLRRDCSTRDATAVMTASSRRRSGSVA